MADDDNQAGGFLPASFSGGGGNAFVPGTIDPTSADGGSSFDDSAALPDMEGDEAAGEGSFTETRSVSWGEKLMGSIVGVLFGLAILVASGVLLFWNEGRAVQTSRSLSEGSGVVVEADPARVDPKNEGKLVHVSGGLSATAPIADQDIGITVVAARLVRHVEMFQWKEESHTETHKRVGGGEDRRTTYSYKRVWHDSRYDSERFHNQSGHSNPPMRFTRFEATATDARLGDFRPTGQALSRLPDSNPEAIPASADGQFPRELGPNHVSGGSLYLGQNPDQPRIGDLRINYRTAPLGTVSFIGRQTGQDLQEFQTKAGDRLLLARSGLVESKAMFEQAEHENAILTWILRLVGCIMMLIGFALLLGPLVAVADVIPLVGDIVGAGTMLAATIMTLVFAPLVIAIAWFVHRPLVSVALLAVGAGLVFGLRRLATSRRQAPAVLVPPPLPATTPPPLPTAA